MWLRDSLTFWLVLVVDGQAIGEESCHLVFFDHLHRHHRNDHLKEEWHAFFSELIPKDMVPLLPEQGPSLSLQ